jgi:Mrp family chromosome partitioning ATPase
MLVAAIVGALALGYLGRPTGPVTYVASHRLIVNPQGQFGTGYSLGQLAVLATEGDLDSAAVDALGGAVPCAVSASADTDLGTLTVRATGRDPDACTEVADVYAQTLLDSLEAENVDTRQAQIDAARSQLVEATQALNVAQAALDADPANPRLAAERDAALSGYSTALANATTVEQQEVPAAGMTSIEPASAAVQEPDGLAGIGVAGRAGLGAALGALVGFAIGLGLDSMDRRIRTAPQCAEAFGAPVIAEVPRARRAFGDGLAPAGSTVMESYRRLRTVVQLSAIERTQGNGHDGRPGHVVLVASPGPKEGKTTTAAHLSAVLAEGGLRVLAVSADFRQPRLDDLLGRPADDSAHGLWLLGPTDIPGVDMVMARERTNEPAALLRDVRRLLDAARSKFDVIVIDTAPVLVANDSLELMPLVDDVILVARSRTTTVTAAERTVDHLGQVGAHVLGIVLTQVSATETYAYYGYRYGYGYGADRPGKSTEPEPARSR